MPLRPSPRPTRASCTARRLRPPSPPARPTPHRPARSAATPRRARVPPTRTTPSPTSTDPLSVGAAPVVVTASSATIPYLSAVPADHAVVLGPGRTATRLRPPRRPARPRRPTRAPPAPTRPSCVGAARPNYTFSYVGGTITITTSAIPVTVTASSATITYGDAIPTITPSYVGFAGGQTVPATTPAPARPQRRPRARVGTYPTTCSGAADPNYSFAYVDGTVTITPAAATVTASSDTFDLRRFGPGDHGRRTRAW